MLLRFNLRAFLLALVFVGLTSPVVAQMALVSGQSFSSGGDHFYAGVSTELDLPVAATSGNLVTVVVYGHDEIGTGFVTSIVDDNGSYTLGVANQNDTIGNFVEIWYRICTGAGCGVDITVTVNAAFSSADDFINAVEFSGAGTQSSLQTNIADVEPVTTHNSGSVTPGVVYNVVVAASAGGEETYTNEAGWTQVTNTGRGVSGYIIQSADTAQQFSPTTAGATYTTNAIVAFKGTEGVMTGGGGSQRILRGLGR